MYYQKAFLPECVYVLSWAANLRECLLMFIDTLVLNSAGRSIRFSV